MIDQPPASFSCEVVILTALPVEFQAVVAHLQQGHEIEHPQTGTIYQTGNFPGKQGVWRVAVAQIEMGGLSAASEAERASNLFHPRMMLFVGVAGGCKDVRHGDVVVATKVYAYEAGKAAASFQPHPQLWHASYALEQRARIEAQKSDWLARVGRQRTELLPRVLSGPLAAGEKVISNQRSRLYRFLQKSYGDSLAVEMEGHGFLQALHANPHIHALVIRGISDLIDDKATADAAGWQNIAAQHAAAFAFQVLATATLPEARSPVTASLRLPSTRFGAPFPEVWNVFRRHNPFFTGRSQVLEELFAGFGLENEGGMIPPQAITGPGGMGKTQTAAQAVLWVRAETQENLLTDFRTIARLLKLPQEHLQDQVSLVQSMQEWFFTQTRWLLILDNADDLAQVDPFLPRAARGHILLTTRAGATAGQAQALPLEPLGPADGALCILRRAGILPWNKPLQEAPESSVESACQLAQLMDGLPLALEQAGAYINDTHSGVERYLHLYRQYRAKIQQIQHGMVPDYPRSVASAWRIAQNIVEQSNPAAFELLRLCAFLAPEAIPDVVITAGASALGPVLGPVAADPIALDQAIGLLRKYSLLNREADRQTDLTRLSIHRIMQEILLDEMDEPTQRLWAERAVRTVAQAFPTMPWAMLQAHVRCCLQFIERWDMTFPEAMLLQQQAAKAVVQESR